MQKSTIGWALQYWRDFKIKLKPAKVVHCSWVRLCRWWQNKLAFVSGMSPRANQFLRSWRHNAVLLMEVSLLLWSDQLLPEIPNGLGAQPSLLISHLHSHCHSSGPSYLLSGLPAALITFGLTSLKITLQSLRFLKLPFYHVTPWSKVSVGLPSPIEWRADFVA